MSSGKTRFVMYISCSLFNLVLDIIVGDIPLQKPRFLHRKFLELQIFNRVFARKKLHFFAIVVQFEKNNLYAKKHLMVYLLHLE